MSPTPRPRYWQFYPKDFWGDELVEDLKPIERCVYLALLARAWNHCGAVMREPVRMLEAIGFPAAEARAFWASLRHLFVEADGGWGQPRQMAEWASASAHRAKLSAAGRSGAAARWYDPAPGAANSPAILAATAERMRTPMPSDSDSDSDSEKNQKRAQAREGPSAGADPPVAPKSKKFDPMSKLAPGWPPAVQAAWGEWVQHRREKRHALTPSTTGKLAKRLEEWGGPRFLAAVEHSVANGYTGLFEPDPTAKADRAARPTPGPPPTANAYDSDPAMQESRDRRRREYEAKEAARRAASGLPATPEPR